MTIRIVLATVLLAAAGCSSPPVDCRCACPPALALEIMHPNGAMPTVSGDVELTCSTTGGRTYCSADDAEAGAHEYEVSLAGHGTRTVTLDARPALAGASCCGVACRWILTRVNLDLGMPDAGPMPDAGTPPADAGRDASAALDAATDARVDAAASSCEPERVEFPAGGDLSVGTLCDDVFVCVPDAGATAAVVAAASQFDCTSEPAGFPCADGEVRCAYRDPGGPSTLDQPEIDAICAVTVLEPPPTRIVCMVWGP